MPTGAWVLLATLFLALAFGLHRARNDGRFRHGEVAATEPASAAVAWSHLEAALPDAELGERATLVQFSTAFCAPCRAARQVLGRVADAVPGVRHVEVDAEQHLELVRRLGVTRTPTTLVLDATGREVMRAAGAPRTEQVLAALPAD